MKSKLEQLSIIFPVSWEELDAKQNLDKPKNLDLKNLDEPKKNCPKCGRDYDDIDFEYQRCSKCGWDAQPNNIWKA